LVVGVSGPGGTEEVLMRNVEQAQAVWLAAAARVAGEREAAVAAIRKVQEAEKVAAAARAGYLAALRAA
jgi:hypothetical protein